MALLRPLRALRALGPRRLVRSLDLAAPRQAFPSPHVPILEEAQRAALAQAEAQAQAHTQAENSLPVATSRLASHLHPHRLFPHPPIPRAFLTLLPPTASGPARGFSDVAAAAAPDPEPPQPPQPPHAPHPELFVGNLGWDLTDEEFAQAFAKFEGFLSARLQRNSPTAKCRGYGFVSFATREDGQVALTAMQGAELNGRSVFMQWAKEREPNAAVFVRSLPWAIDSEGLRSAFSQCGEIEFCRVLTQPGSGRSRGSGLVVFESAEAAQRAVNSMHGQILKGRPIRVNFATQGQAARVQKNQENEEGHAAASAVESAANIAEESAVLSAVESTTESAAESAAEIVGPGAGGEGSPAHS